MSLAKYWKKRDFSITPEPSGNVNKSKATKPGDALQYFIQRHHARRLHYDFRLELNGTLKSWAVPKGPSLNPADKRLAVHVEDHPLAYGTFEGEIPAGQYGAGQVVLWDKGIWLPLSDPVKGYREGHLKFELQGHKLEGTWALVRMHGKAEESQENWLLIKEKDELAQTGSKANITELRPESVLKLAANSAKKQSVKNQSAQKQQAHTAKKPKVGAVKKSEAAQAALNLPQVTLPDFVQPQLATLVKTAPVGDDWLSEVKYDGYRALARIAHGKVKLYTRNANDWTHHWPAVAEMLQTLPVETAWLDGEVVAMQNGKISFAALQDYERDTDTLQLRYFVFDLLHLDGHDLADLPLTSRKELLQTLLANQSGAVVYSDHIIGNAKAVHAQACAHQLEGIVLKRADSRYSGTRNQDWLKLKCIQRQEFVIGGFTDPSGGRQGLGALLLGWYNADKQLVYAGRVGTGFSQQVANTLAKRLKTLEVKQPAYLKPPTGYEAKGVHWVKPILVAEVNFAEWTPDGMVRHAAFVALRDDKAATDISRETPQAVHEDAASSKTTSKITSESNTHSQSKMAKSSKAKPKEDSMANKPSEITSGPASGQASAAAADNVVDGVKISHPERVVYKEDNVTKLDVAKYYQSVESWIMPHIAGRPLSLLRCPDGTEQECFFQKHLSQLTLKYVQKIDLPDNDNGEYLVVNDMEGLIELVQMGVIEFHTWGSSIGSERDAESLKQVQLPDRMIFDLDPDPGVPWEKVIEGAKLVEFLLTNISLESYLKTTGGKGLHIVVPIQPEHDFDTIKAFSKSIAYHLAETIPSHFVAVMSKAKRKDKIFVDYLRNGEEATAIAAYSLRARSGAPISVPLRWDELTPELTSNFFNIRNIYDRVLDLPDPWENYFTQPQRITEAMLGTFPPAR